MTSTHRWLIVAIGILALAVAAQTLLLHHLTSAVPDVAYPYLMKPFAALPTTLSATTPEESDPEAPVWIGGDLPGIEQLRDKLKFRVDDLLSRGYQLRGTDLGCSLYLVHSRDGADRNHHPEICIREVTGAPEDWTARKTLHLGGDPARPVQRFRFKTGTQQYTTVYYWHYTFSPRAEAAGSPLQQAHLRVGYPSPSVTVQVATAAPQDRLALVEQSLLPLLEAHLSSHHLPPSRMACDRTPITLIRH